MSKTFQIDVEHYERSADILRVMGHSVRLRLMHELINKGALNVSELCRLLDIPQSTVSQHLGKLKSLKMVSYERNGLEVYYRVDDENLIEVIKVLSS